MRSLSTTTFSNFQNPNTPSRAQITGISSLTELSVSRFLSFSLSPQAPKASNNTFLWNSTAPDFYLFHVIYSSMLSVQCPSLPFSVRSIHLVQFSRSVVTDSLWPHGLQHARPPCRSPTPRVYPNSCPLSRWCHPTISSSVIPFSSCLQSFPASGLLQCQFFTAGGQSIGVSASTSALPMNIQDWFPLGWTGWISLQSKGLSRVFSNTTVQKHQFFGAQPSSQSNSHIHTWLLEKL